MNFQSRNHYLQVPFALSLGFFLGIFMPIVIYYHQWWSTIFIGGFKTFSITFFMGLLGGTCQMSIGFAREINTLVTKPSEVVLPSYYEGFGYLLKQVWGGIAAVIFVLAVKQGYLAAFEQSDKPIELEALVVISFVAGLNAYRILKQLSQILKFKKE
ncbi:hypothetical protein [Maribacter sp. Hel_I_7]|jgi:hypothetical protein|uniref:hypothetical protein n=1 Tax=Maribacter sp. Hel_I_7 TaxID=1249997 RepID=UPI00047CF10B|nr:hypothetical protein [Maribacter sp. Hel_I_7]|tara:strand:+ start:4565 stop:5035 length:471 start_codon:yes stop_codon:yes gene_type:complete